MLKELYPSVDMPRLLQDLPQARAIVYGGFLRDLALGRRPKEADIILVGAGSYETFEQKAERALAEHGFTLLGAVRGEKRASCHFLPPGETRLESIIDINFRHELERPLSDFTINSLWMDLASGEVHDSYGAIHDLEQGVLRSVRSPRETFREKPLHVFRAIKCACQFGLTIEAATEAGIRGASKLAIGTLAEIADNPQTILGEWMLDNVFRGLKYDPRRYWSLSAELGVLDVFERFLSRRLGITIPAGTAQPSNPFAKRAGGSYEQSLSLFFSALADRLAAADQKEVFGAILSLWGIGLPNKYHHVGIDSRKLRYRKVVNQ